DPWKTFPSRLADPAPRSRGNHRAGRPARTPNQPAQPGGSPAVDPLARGHRRRTPGDRQLLLHGLSVHVGPRPWTQIPAGEPDVAARAAFEVARCRVAGSLSLGLRSL